MFKGKKGFDLLLFQLLFPIAFVFEQTRKAGKASIGIIVNFELLKSILRKASQ